MPIDITDQTRRVQYAISGTGPYDFDFEVLEQTDIAVYRDATLLILTTDYTVALNSDGTGAATLVAATGTTLTIIGARPYRRITDYATGGDFRAETLNDEFDSLQIQILQIVEALERTFTLAPTSVFSGGGFEFPDPVDGYYMRGTVDGIEWTSGIVDSGNFLATGAGAQTRSVTAKLSDFVSVADYATVAAARNRAEAIGVPLIIPVGVWNANGLTFACDLVFLGGSLTSASAATINGVIDAPFDREILSGAGAWTVSKTANPVQRVAWFPGATVDVRINALKTAATNGPVTALLGPGTHNFSTIIDLTNTTGFHLTCGSEGSNADTILQWTGGAGSGSAIKAPGSRSFQFSNITLTYNSAAYNGNLLSLSSTGGAQNTSRAHLHHCRIAGQVGAVLAARLVELNTSLKINIGPECLFNYAVDGVGCSGDSNNSVHVHDNWFDLNFSGAQVRARGTNWNISDNVFESGTTLTTGIALAGGVTNLTLVNNEFVDGGAGGGTLVDLTGQAANGVSLIGNFLSGGSGTAVALSTTAGQTSGFSARGNAFTGVPTGVHLGRATGVEMSGNTWGGITTAWTGTAPTRMSITANDTSAAAAGISVANDATLVIASGTDAIGYVDIIVVQDNAIATYFLNGASNTAECFDQGAIFTISQGTASSVNIYKSGTDWLLENKRGAARTFIVNYRGR